MTTQVLLSVPDDVYERVAAAANALNQPVQEILNDAIVWDAAAIADVPQMSKQEKKEEEAFVRLHPQLRNLYPDQFVAIYNEEVVDHDIRFGTLHDRISEKYGDEFVLISAVEETPDEPLYVSSFRFVEQEQ